MSRNFFFIKPEVPGGWAGDKSEADVSVHPPIIHRLDFEFDDWMGSALITSFPVFAVTAAGRAAIVLAKLNGATFDDMMVSKSGLFEDLNPDGMDLPPFYWLKVHGVPGEDDFGIAFDHRLVISERALAALESVGIPDAIITGYPGEPANDED